MTAMATGKGFQDAVVGSRGSLDYNRETLVKYGLGCGRHFGSRAFVPTTGSSVLYKEDRYQMKSTPPFKCQENKFSNL